MSSTDKPKPKQQPPFSICNADWLHVGTIAIFGLDETRYPDIEDFDGFITGYARKVHSISYQPGPLVLSRMGEDVPEPVFDGDYPETTEWRAINFSLVEKQLLDKVFAIMFIRGYDQDGGEAFCYVNVRCDRIDTLIERVTGSQPINVPDYATIVLTGTGSLAVEDREKLQRDYLFGERHCNVRIFPPLSEVT